MDRAPSNKACIPARNRYLGRGIENFLLSQKESQAMASRSLTVSSSRSRGKSRGDVARSKDGVDMDADGVFHTACIAPCERRRDGNSTLARFFKHPAVPQHQALLRQGQSTELVFTIRVCTANVKNHVRTK